MSSQIKEIYQAISDMDIVLNGAVVPVKKPSELPNSIQTANLPVRLLTPIHQFIPGFITSDNWNAGLGSGIVQATWNVVDIFLYEPVNQTIGVRALTDPLIDYCKIYIDAMNAGELALPNNVVNLNYIMRPDIINYPLGGATFYYGVYTYHTILEKIP